jgi:hypothetical protein
MMALDSLVGLGQVMADTKVLAVGKATTQDIWQAAKAMQFNKLICS